MSDQDLQSLPYAIRVFVQNREASDQLDHSLAEQEKKEIDSLSRDRRDWHHPGERTEAIDRIRWRYRERADLRSMAHLCVESEVVRLAEAFMPSAIANADSGQRWSEVVREAFIIAERFIDERDRRGLAIRTANVDSLLENGNG